MTETVRYTGSYCVKDKEVTGCKEPSGYKVTKNGRY